MQTFVSNPPVSYDPVMTDGAQLKASILVVEDDADIRSALVPVLEEEGYQVVGAEDGTAGLAALDGQDFDIVLSDLRMPGPDGLAILKKVREVAPQTLFLLMSAHATVESAVEALHLGAQDYLIKPFLIDDVLHKIAFLLRHRQLAWENQLLRRQLESQWDYENMVGKSAAMREVMNLVRRVAPTPATVLITGESGTGKEVVARAIHHFSAQRDRIFLPVNCGAIPETLLESQLFGHLRGSFTGALANQEGVFQQARGGTLFLDEIGDLPLALQVKLLRAIETKEVLPVGASKPVKVDFRLIAATNRNLQQAVEEKTFRDDLYYRLTVMAIEIPPLRERWEDIPPLIEHFVHMNNVELKKGFRGVDNVTLRLLIAQPWKGNVRELRNVIEHAMILGEGDWITVKDLPRELRSSEEAPSLPDDLREALRISEKAHIEAVLGRCNGDKRAAAQRLGVSLSSLYRKIEELKIQS